MATTTPNYGWDVPTSTDYVKDGATAIETLGDDIDATLYTALGGAYPGLRLIKKQTISAGVSSVTVTGAFSATYDAYKIVLTNIATSGSTSINMTFGSTATGYYYASTAALFATANYSTQVGAANSANFVAMGNNGGAAASTMLEVSSPFTNTKTMFSAGYINVSGGAAGVVNGYVDNTTSYTAFTLTPGSGTLSSGTIYVYGYGAS